MSSMYRCAALALCLCASSAWGQAIPAREPSSSHIFPAGGRRGTIVTVRVGGQCFPPGMKLTLWGAGVTALPLLGSEVAPRYEPPPRRPPRDADGGGAAMTYPREWASTIRLAADAPLGPRFWRVSGGWGGTQLRPFLVGDLPEFIETEPNSLPELAQRITLPVVVNGQIAGERDLDFFVFSAHAGEVVVCDVLAARLGSPLDPIVEITDLKGRQMDVCEVRAGTDPIVSFRVPATGDYRVSIGNVGFQGGPHYVYRMTLSTAPFAAYAFPPGARAADRREVQLYTLTGTATPRASTELVSFPSTPGRFRLRGAVPLVAGEYAEVVALDEHHSRAKAMALAPPVTVSGRFSRAADEDWFQFTAKKGEAFSIQCRPFPETSPALPVVRLYDTAGNLLGKASAAEAADRSVDMEWRAPAAGTFRLCVRDLQHGTRGGPEFIYRLTLRPAQPDFALRVEPDFVNVVQGGKTEVEFSVRRHGGFTGAIDLNATGMPPGVQIVPSRVAEGQTQLKLAVLARDDVHPTGAALRIHGKATIVGMQVERSVQVTPVGLGADEGDRLPGVNELHLTVQHKPVFRLTCNEAYQYAHRGTIYPYPMQVERLNGFTGPITIQLCDRQVQDLDGIEVIETVVPSGVTAFQNLVYLPETMHVSVQHHSRPYVQGYATFVDRWGQKQTLLAVSEKRCMIRTLPTLVKLQAGQSGATARPGEVLACGFNMDRTPNFTDAVRLEMVKAAGFTANAVRMEAGSSHAVVAVHVDKSVPAPAETRLRFRASGKLQSGATVITEATVTVKLEK